MEKKTVTIKVTDKDRGKRIDKFLAEQEEGEFSRSRIQNLIRSGSVLVDGSAVKCHHKVSGGETIELIVPPPVEPSVKAQEIPVDIVYEDAHLLVVDKPAGLVVHPAPGNYSGTLVNALLAHCEDLSGVGGVLKPGIVHRIDKGTSGLLVVAKTDEAHQGLARQFKDKSIRRVYAALVKGVMELDNDIIELPIGRSLRDRKKMAVNFAVSKSAVTQYKVIRRFKGFTLIEATLGTGRTHQIRVHLSYIGHPLLGDEKYGTGGILARPALHARMLGFIHPATKKYMEFSSKIPKDMQDLIDKG